MIHKLRPLLLYVTNLAVWKSLKIFFLFKWWYFSNILFKFFKKITKIQIKTAKMRLLLSVFGYFQSYFHETSFHFLNKDFCFQFLAISIKQAFTFSIKLLVLALNLQLAASFPTLLLRFTLISKLQQKWQSRKFFCTYIP